MHYQTHLKKKKSLVEVCFSIFFVFVVFFMSCYCICFSCGNVGTADRQFKTWTLLPCF